MALGFPLGALYITGSGRKFMPKTRRFLVLPRERRLLGGLRVIHGPVDNPDFTLKHA